MMGLQGVPSFFPVGMTPAIIPAVIPAVIKDMEKRERSHQFKRAHIHEPGKNLFSCPMSNKLKNFTKLDLFLSVRYAI